MKRYDVWIQVVARGGADDGDHMSDEKLGSFSTLEAARNYVGGLPEPIHICMPWSEPEPRLGLQATTGDEYPDPTLEEEAALLLGLDPEECGA